MAAIFLKIGDIKGEAADQNHKDQIRVGNVSQPIHRSIPDGAKEQQRARGTTTLGDIHIVKDMDKASVKLAESCANGTFYSEAEIHYCQTINNKEETIMTWKLSNVLITGYSISGSDSGTAKVAEEFSLNFEKIEWTYNQFDNMGKKQGAMTGKYNPAKGLAG